MRRHAASPISRARWLRQRRHDLRHVVIVAGDQNFNARLEK